MSGHHLDQANRRADAVSALARERHGKLPAKLQPDELKAIIAEADATLAVVDVARCYDARNAGNMLRPVRLADYEAVMAGQGGQ